MPVGNKGVWRPLFAPAASEDGVLARPTPCCSSRIEGGGDASSESITGSTVGASSIKKASPE